MRTPESIRRTGFTLVEVTLTVLIMGMLLVAISQLLTAARRSRDTIHNIQETQLAGPAIMDLITRDLRGVLTLGIPREDQMRVKNRVSFGFDADSLDFLTTTDNLQFTWDNDRALRADWGEVGYRLRPNPDNDDFLEIYRREAFGSDSHEGEPYDSGRYTFLHDQVKGLDILVYPEDGPEVEPLEEWGVDPTDQETMGLPARLEIRLTLELAPRISREQISIVPLDQRTVTFTRLIRLPEVLRVADSEAPRLGVPPLPSEDSGAGGGAAGGGAPGTDDKSGAGGAGTGGVGGATGGTTRGAGGGKDAPGSGNG